MTLRRVFVGAIPPRGSSLEHPVGSAYRGTMAQTVPTCALLVSLVLVMRDSLGMARVNALWDSGELSVIVTVLEGPTRPVVTTVFVTPRTAHVRAIAMQRTVTGPTPRVPHVTPSTVAWTVQYRAPCTMVRPAVVTAPASTVNVRVMQTTAIRPVTFPSQAVRDARPVYGAVRVIIHARGGMVQWHAQGIMVSVPMGPLVVGCVLATQGTEAHPATSPVPQMPLTHAAVTDCAPSKWVPAPVTLATR